MFLIIFVNIFQEGGKALSRTIGELLKSLSNRDIEALKSIYDLRCLTVTQIYELHYKKSSRGDGEIVSDAYCKKKMNEFVELEILEKVDHMGEDVMFLTTKGVNLIRHCYDLPANIYDVNKGVIRRGYYRAFELKIAPKYISHQLCLNQFLIDFKLREHDVYWKYYDEKYISQFQNIRPDGLLTMFDIDFFIEIDMGTESKNQLYEKWDNYRRFLDSQEYEYIERKIVVLFVIENTANPQARIDLVKHTLGARLMDKIDSNFEIYVGTKEDMLSILDEKIEVINGKKKDFNDEIFSAMANHGFSVALGEKLKNIFNGIEYDFYCRKIDENNHVVIENNRIQEFIVDSYRLQPFSVLKKIAFLHLSNVYFKEKLGRKLSYIVVGESIESLYRDLKIMDLLVVDNVYYTTLDRLKNKPFHEALFQFDFLGNIHSFKNNGLDDREFEFNIAEQIAEREKEPNYYASS